MSSILSFPVPGADQTGATDQTGAAPAPSMYAAAGIPQLQRNPQLPEHPLGAYTDAQYEAQVAQLKFEIAQRYNDVLSQLGYTDENGNFVPGQAEVAANRQQSELTRNSQLATEGVTQENQRAGTLFSGLRATAAARAQFPFQQAIAQLGVDVPKQLTDLYGQAGGLVNEFTTRHNLLLADAAARQAAAFMNQPAAGGGGGGGSVTPPSDGGAPAGSNPPGTPATGDLLGPAANVPGYVAPGQPGYYTPGTVPLVPGTLYPAEQPPPPPVSNTPPYLIPQPGRATPV